MARSCVRSVHSAALFAGLVVAGCTYTTPPSPPPPPPTDLVRTVEPVDGQLCFALDGDAPETSRAQVWYWDSPDENCASTESEIAPATGIIEVGEEATSLSFQVPTGPTDYSFRFVEDSSGLSLLTDEGRRIRLQRIDELRLPGPGGLETPAP